MIVQFSPCLTWLPSITSIVEVGVVSNYADVEAMFEKHGNVLKGIVCVDIPRAKICTSCEEAFEFYKGET